MIQIAQKVKVVDNINSGLPNLSELLLTIIVPTFDTKVTEYLCSGWVIFFFRQIFIFYLAIFDGIFLYHSKGIVVLSLNLKRYFTCDHFW